MMDVCSMDAANIHKWMAKLAAQHSMSGCAPSTKLSQLLWEAGWDLQKVLGPAECRWQDHVPWYLGRLNCHVTEISSDNKHR